jgi:hypothetical protein
VVEVSEVFEAEPLLEAETYPLGADRVDLADAGEAALLASRWPRSAATGARLTRRPPGG